MSNDETLPVPVPDDPIAPTSTLSIEDAVTDGKIILFKDDTTSAELARSGLAHLFATRILPNLSKQLANKDV